MARVESLPRRLDADQLDRVTEEGMEASDCIRAAADTGDHAARQRSLGLQRLGAGLVPDHALQVSNQRRVWRGADHRADHVVGVRDGGGPIADRGADGLLQRPGTGLDPDHLGTQQPHPLDVRGLAADVLAAHVDGAPEAHQRARRRRGDAVLPRPGLGDHAALSHPTGEQGLADRVVDLVGAGVDEVLALQVDPAAEPLREPLGQIERGGAADEVPQQRGELGLKALVITGLGPGCAELVESRDQGLGHEPASVGAEALLDCRAHGEVTLTGSCTPAAPRKASTLAWSLRPGSASTPLTTSTANGFTSSIASATFSAVRPPARTIGTLERRFATSSQSKLLPVPPWIPCQ